MTGRNLLAIDQGTTSTRAIMFRDGRPQGAARRDLVPHYPAEGWVEHDPEALWQTVLATAREVLAALPGGAGAVAALGLTNQRETTLLWEREGGRVLHPAIVWQDRRTADFCAALRDQGVGTLIAARTGLVIDPYFSATKLAWLLDHLPGTRDRARRGELCFGTVDSFLLWRLTGGRLHVTDATNAARTMLFDINRQTWDPELLALFDIPAELLPAVRDSAGDFGATVPDLFGAAIPIRGVAGDQQAAAVGQACFSAGAIKATYGTGCFVLVHTGAAPIASRHRLLSTVACRLGDQPGYALEGSIFVAGAAIQWLRDALKLFPEAAMTAALAATAKADSNVVLVPAFTGLGAPHWAPAARGALFGLTRDSGIAELTRAALEAVAFQTRDLTAAIAQDLAAQGRPAPTSLRVDGGMVANDWLMQCLADLTGLAVERPVVSETTALGAALLAGFGAGLYGSTRDLAASWALDRRFEPRLGAAERDRRYGTWQDAVARVLQPSTTRP